MHNLTSSEKNSRRTKSAKEHNDKARELYSALYDMGYDAILRKYDIYIKLNRKRVIAIYVALDSYKIYTNHIEWLQHTTYESVLDEYGYTHYHVPTFESCIEEVHRFFQFMSK